MSKDITKAHQWLQDFWGKLKPMYEANNPGYSLILTHVDRTQPEQLALFCKGRLTNEDRVTNCDGYNKISKHNMSPSHAFDVAVVELATGKALWDKKYDPYYLKLGEYLYELGLTGTIRWGGTFNSVKDYPHFELL